MNNRDNLTMIAVAHIRPALAGETDLIERVRKAFREAQSFWLSTDDDVRFRGAVAAVVLETTDPDQKERLELTLHGMNAVGALMAGVPVDIDVALAGLDDVDPVPMVQLWREAKEAGRQCTP